MSYIKCTTLPCSSRKKISKLQEIHQFYVVWWKKIQQEFSRKFFFTRSKTVCTPLPATFTQCLPTRKYHHPPKSLLASNANLHWEQGERIGKRQGQSQALRLCSGGAGGALTWTCPSAPAALSSRTAGLPRHHSQCHPRSWWPVRAVKYRKSSFLPSVTLPWHNKQLDLRSNAATGQIKHDNIVTVLIKSHPTPRGIHARAPPTVYWHSTHLYNL